MRRNVSLEEISNGQLYSENDMVRADCHGCRGCYQCCIGMGHSVILDPLDVYRLKQGTGKDMGELLALDFVELHVVDGVILPNLKMAGEEERCAFLNADGRCSIHESRPGLCRLFPLGRYYEEDGDFKYFLQTGECKAAGLTKVKVGKWIDVADKKKNHDFIRRWHQLQKQMEKVAEREEMEEQKQKNLLFLKTFFMTPYDGKQDFYKQFEERWKVFQYRIYTA